MAWWHDPLLMFLWACPLAALLSGLMAGFVSRNWGFGLLTGAATIVIPLLSFEVVAIQFFIYAPLYALIGLIGSTVGWGLAKLYTRNGV